MNASPHRLVLVVVLLLAQKVHADFDLAADLYRQKNYAAAFEAFKAQADTGDPRAETVLALMYKFGEGVPQDLQSAFIWYRRAADRGYAPAQFHTGIMLAEGIGVEADTDVAIDYLKQAAEQGFERAQHRLAQLNASAATRSDVAADQAWSQDWDFRLPNEYRLLSPEAETPQPERYVVQIGAMGTQDSARRLWHLLTDTHPDLFADLTPKTLRVERDGQALHRVYTGDFDSKAKAQAFCDRLLSRRLQAGCVPLKRDQRGSIED